MSIKLYKPILIGIFGGIAIPISLIILTYLTKIIVKTIHNGAIPHDNTLILISPFIWIFFITPLIYALVGIITAWQMNNIKNKFINVVFSSMVAGLFASIIGILGYVFISIFGYNPFNYLSCDYRILWPFFIDCIIDNLLSVPGIKRVVTGTIISILFGSFYLKYFKP